MLAPLRSQATTPDKKKKKEQTVHRAEPGQTITLSRPCAGLLLLCQAFAVACRKGGLEHKLPLKAAFQDGNGSLRPGLERNKPGSHLRTPCLSSVPWSNLPSFMYLGVLGCWQGRRQHAVTFLRHTTQLCQAAALAEDLGASRSSAGRSRIPLQHQDKKKCPCIVEEMTTIQKTRIIQHVLKHVCFRRRDIHVILLRTKVAKWFCAVELELQAWRIRDPSPKCYRGASLEIPPKRTLHPSAASERASGEAPRQGEIERA